MRVRRWGIAIGSLCPALTIRGTSTEGTGCQMQWMGAVQAPKRALHLIERLALSIEGTLPK